jgi:flagellar hook-associated protein 2
MFSFSGLASGINSGAIIQQLVALERLPIQRFQAQKAEQKTKLDLIGTLRTHVKSLQDAAGDMRTPAKFLSFRAQASREGVAALTVTGQASVGSHTLTVLSLAQIDRWAFDALPDDTAALAAGPGQTVSFSVGGVAYEVLLDPEESNIHQVASTINSQAGAAVAATVVNTGTEGAPSFQLVLTSKGSGTDKRIVGLTSSVAALSLDATPPDGAGQAGSLNNITVGTNALAIVDGLQIERSTNKLDGVLAGITIDLLSANSGEELTFTVSADTAAIRARIQRFVDAHNQVMGFIGAQNAYSEDSGPGGKLFGDSILSSVRREIRAALFGGEAQLSSDEGYASLAMVGIKLDNKGQLGIDQTVLDAKLAANLGSLTDLFVDHDGFDNGGAAPNTPGFYTDTTADGGIAERLHRAIARMFDTLPGPDGVTLKGLFDTRADALNTTMKRFDKQIEQRERLLERFEANLVKRFSALEQLMGSLNAQGAALNSVLLSLQPRNNR